MMSDNGDGGTVGIIAICAFDAHKLEASIERIPESVTSRISGLFIPVVVDISPDAYAGPLATARDLPELEKLAQRLNIPITTAHVSPADAQYGALQKLAFNWAIERNMSIAVVVHGAGLFPLDKLDQFVEPVRKGETIAVIATRTPHEVSLPSDWARYVKFLGNSQLTSYLNKITNISLDDWLCPFRAYSARALHAVQYEKNSDGHIFDLEMLMTLNQLNQTILQRPVAIAADVQFGLLECVMLAKDSIFTAIRYRMSKMGFGTESTAFSTDAYELKCEETSSHSHLQEWMRGRPKGDVLDIGCSDGQFGALLEEMGHTVTGIDLVEHEGVKERISQFVTCDLERGLPTALAGRQFDTVILADVLEHVTAPDRILRGAKRVLHPDGSILVSVPNLGHWYGRLKVGLGLFSYDRRGLFDYGHVRFFTRVTFERMVANEGLAISRTGVTGTPFFDVLSRGSSRRASSGALGRLTSGAGGTVSAIRRFPMKVWPSLFGYQLLFELRVPVLEHTAKRLFHEIPCSSEGTATSVN